MRRLSVWTIIRRRPVALDATAKNSTALLLWHEYDFTINRRLIKENQLELKGAELKERLHALEALHGYACENHKCRWGMIREIFWRKIRQTLLKSAATTAKNR